MEYCVPFWPSCSKEDAVMLERMRKSAFVRMLPGHEGLRSRERLGRLGQYSLKQKGLLGDLDIGKCDQLSEHLNQHGLFGWKGPFLCYMSRLLILNNILFL